MGARMEISIKKGNQYLNGLYFHWGLETFDEIRTAVLECCKTAMKNKNKYFDDMILRQILLSLSTFNDFEIEKHHLLNDFFQCKKDKNGKIITWNDLKNVDFDKIFDEFVKLNEHQKMKSNIISKKFEQLHWDADSFIVDLDKKDFNLERSV